MLDGRRIWIVAGEVHYFRLPRAEWRQALLRAKRAGLNTISTYVPWNFHEMKEGRPDFDGDKDLAGYIDLIGELGMYAMLRPGPYICSEWDGGGIPAWLCDRPVRRFRDDDPVFMAAVERWFDHLLPIIAARQVTKGGPVITIQNENEYPGGYAESMRSYIAKLSGCFRKHGIEVPILACNVHGASRTDIKINYSMVTEDQILDPGMILTYNHHVVVEPIRELRKMQPDAPLMVSEFWGGHPIYWGKDIRNYPNDQAQARAAYEYTSLGTQMVYYMFEGGTNFGFWGGNNIATSYAASYPVGEAGKLTNKYFALRPVNLFASQFGEFLADSEEVLDKAGLECQEGVRLVVRRSPQGSMAFLSTADLRREITMTLPDEARKELIVQLGDVPAAALPYKLKVLDQVTIDYSNLCLLVRDESRKVLIVFGPAGTQGIISVNGRELQIPVGRRKVEYREVDGLHLYVADEEMARRCWIVDGGRIVLGPDYAAESHSDGTLHVKISDAAPEVITIDEGGRMESNRYVYEAPIIQPPELSPWKLEVCSEIDGGQRQQGDWTALDEPRSHEALGVELGYVWYRAELECEEDGVEKLLFTHTPNRVCVFVNGEYSGEHAAGRSVRMRDEYGHPADWAFEELTVRVQKGTNRLVFLSDNLGHNYDVPVPVGIQGPVYLGSRSVDIRDYRETTPFAVSEDAYHFLYRREYRTPEPLPAVEFELPLEADQQAFITIHGVHAWVTLEGEDVLPMSYPESPWTMFSEIKRWISWQLPASASGNNNTVRIQYAGDTPRSVLEHMAVYIVPKSGACTNWQWKVWERPTDVGASPTVNTQAENKDHIEVWLPIGSRVQRKGRLLKPAWLESSFPMPDGEQPLYLKMGELQKGQIYLNGHNVGRIWRSGGTQEAYYLPRGWMKATNHLVIFEELGLYPQNVSLAFGDSGRWQDQSL